MSALHRNQIFNNLNIDYLDKINFHITWKNHIYEPLNMLISQICQLEFKQSGDSTEKTNKGSVQSSSGINISEQVPPRFRSKTHPHCCLLLSKSLLQPHCVTRGIFGVDFRIL